MFNLALTIMPSAESADLFIRAGSLRRSDEQENRTYAKVTIVDTEKVLAPISGTFFIWRRMTQLLSTKIFIDICTIFLHYLSRSKEMR